MKYEDLEFKKMDLKKHQKIAIEFQKDAVAISFGSEDSFWEEDGQGDRRYIDWLKKKDPKKFRAFHIWKGCEIIGQIELDLLFNEDETWGYVRLYYLKKEYRGKGYSKILDDFAVDFFLKLDLKRAKLSVSPTNIRAIKFYEKNGWVNKGPRLSKEHSNLIHLMEKVF